MSKKSESSRASIASDEDEDATVYQKFTETKKPKVTPSTSDNSEGDHDSDRNTDMSSEDDEESPIQLSIDAIKTFMQSDNKTPYPIDLKIEYLRHEGYDDNESNYDMWRCGVEVLARLYRVWPILSGDAWLLPNESACCEHINDQFPHLAMWKRNEEAMVDVACALVYANVSEDLRDDYDFQESMKTREPRIIMGFLENNLGPGSME